MKGQMTGGCTLGMTLSGGWTGFGRAINCVYYAHISPASIWRSSAPLKLALAHRPQRQQPAPILIHPGVPGCVPARPLHSTTTLTSAKPVRGLKSLPSATIHCSSRTWQHRGLRLNDEVNAFRLHRSRRGETVISPQRAASSLFPLSARPRVHSRHLCTPHDVEHSPPDCTIVGLCCRRQQIPSLSTPSATASGTHRPERSPFASPPPTPSDITPGFSRRCQTRLAHRDPIVYSLASLTDQFPHHVVNVLCVADPNADRQ
jgi:hypothetical protein